MKNTVTTQVMVDRIMAGAKRNPSGAGFVAYSKLPHGVASIWGQNLAQLRVQVLRHVIRRIK